MIRILVAILLSACSSLSDIDPDVCGNGILEPGEDCDASDPRCVACGIQCDAGIGPDGDAQCAAYPGALGFVCGADQLCHAPAGKFREATQLSTSIDTFRATDIDRDGYGDLVVQSATAIRVLFGNADGHPTTSQQVLTPIARGAATYADLDLDSAGKLDVLLPAADGIVAYTSPYGVLSPYPFPSIVSASSEGTPYFSNPIADGVIGIVGRPANTSPGSPVVYLVRDVSDTAPGGFVAMAPVCGATDENFDPRAISIFDVRTNYQLFATTFREGTTRRVCVLAIEKIGQAYSITPLPVNLGAGRVPASRPVLAPIGGGACPSLVLRETAGDVIALAGAGTTTCSYSGTPVVRQLSSTFGDPVGWAPLVPPDAGSGATVALAMQAGVFAVPASGVITKPLYIADRPLASIRAADLDGDGDIDVVASSVMGGELVEDIDLLSRFSMGFTRYRFDTEGPVDQLTIGDYDGNGISDVGYVQTRVIGGADRYELQIAYGTTDQLVPGISAGTFGKIISVIPAEIPDSNDPFSVVTDLVVLYEDGAQSAISILHGSPQRTMLGFFDPRSTPQPTIFRGVAAGHFNDAAGPRGLDMIAVEDGDAGVPRVWRSNGPTGTEVSTPVANTVSLLGDCAKGSPLTNLCIDDAVFVAWPMTDTSDRVIALGADRAGDPRIITFDPHAPTTTFPATMWPDLTDNRARIRAAEVVRVAGAPHLLITLTVMLEAKLLLCTVGADGMPVTCTDLAAQIAAEAVCTHATSARIAPVTRFMDAPPTATELLAICHERGNASATTIFRFDAALKATSLLRVGAARELRVGDVDGNGIDDIVTVDRETAIPTLRIYRQCTAREATTCGR
jgi:hypothetical protein